jgi:hypothetical protein
MDLRKVAAGIVWLPLLGGCMGMAPGGHAGAGGGGYGPHVSAAPVHAEASNGELMLALSLREPIAGPVVDIDVRLVAESSERDAADPEVRLRIRTPQGGVDELVMDRIHSSMSGTYHERYVFRNPGPHMVTAEAWSARGEVPAVSVTAEADVVGYRDGHDWLMPAAIVGGLAMLTMMVVMMAF